MLYTVFRDFIDLCFPECCACCGRKLLKGEEALCLFCETELPRLHDFAKSDNAVAKLFWGRVDLVNATAVYQFRQRGMLQKLLHVVKYEGRDDVARKLGQVMAHQVFSHPELKYVDCVLPVPLHNRRQKERGYNQSEEIAKGLVANWGKELEVGNLIRHIYSKSQTKKDRMERWSNVNTIFKVLHPHRLEGKHILLLDDVVTTGSTLEACAAALSEVQNVKISVLALAFPTYD